MLSSGGWILASKEEKGLPYCMKNYPDGESSQSESLTSLKIHEEILLSPEL